MNRLSRYFISGLIVLFPIVITYFVLATSFSIIEGSLEKYIPLRFPGSGILFLVLTILLAGWFTNTWKWGTQIILKYFEKLVDRIPIVKFIYNSVKRVSTMLFESKTMFSQVVLIPYPNENLRSIGFLMPKPSLKMAKALGNDEYESVFLPWSLNMTSGFNVFVKREELTYLDISVEDAFQYILTAGGVMPGAQYQDNLAELQQSLPTGFPTVDSASTERETVESGGTKEAVPSGQAEATSEIQAAKPDKQADETK